ncbi:MAG: DUF393 domain-containing protein [Anaerolineales bacterium]|nr:DUF393 domain-containing protein [Anaerolineales bacterium]
MDHGIILFDGVCNLCNGVVDFVIRHDPIGYFRFAALQSPAGQKLATCCGQPTNLETVILFDDGVCRVHSTAALAILRRLGWPWNMLVVFSLVPLPMRDAVYSWIARRRYAWFGVRSVCRLPTPSERGRFMEDIEGSI